MNAFHNTNDSTFWSCTPDQMAVWSEVAGNEQVAVAFESDAAVCIISKNLDWVFDDVFEDWPDTGDDLSDLNATSVEASNPGFANLDNVPINHGHMNADVPALWHPRTPPLTDSETTALLLGDALWDGYIVPPTQHVEELLGNPIAFGPAAEVPLSPTELAWLPQFSSLPLSYADSDGVVVKSDSPDLSSDGAVGTTLSAQVNALPLGVTDMDIGPTISCAASMPASTRTILGKRPHDEEGRSAGYVHVVDDINTPCTSKRARRKLMLNGVLEATGSTSRVPQKPANRPLTRIGRHSEAAERGASKLAVPNAQGVSYQSLPGPSSQKDLVGTTVQGKLPGVEESEKETMWYYAGSVVLQQRNSNSTMDSGREGRDRERAHFEVPKRLSKRHKSLLEATSEDLARGEVRELKCRMCPGAGFSNWEDFKRHCDLMEAHPLKILFCRDCGDFFARSDSLERHHKHRPPECFDVSPTEAEVKRTETKKAHEAFKERLEQCLESNTAIGTPFAQIIKAMYPNSSKRGSRQQCRLKAPSVWR